ncbi:unnamed protein product [Rotaria sordida]|uniref:Uncharacterized protein n=1 Tax=Rotaria sordida TaxID=392033 RepID=A0A815HIV5_9BILA|nr:unnamed protein product [Rotaria sordida]CAF3903104.1 unnamed protein product [Rotaria sordida]
MMSSQEQKDQSLNIPSAPSGRIRSQSLRPQYSRLDYTRRKSTADISSSNLSCLEVEKEENQLEQSSKIFSSSWLKRRFTLFFLEHTINKNRRMTTDCSYNINDKSCSKLLRKKRPSTMTQMMESFVRRFSSRKKKHHDEHEHEEDQTTIDPVYETLKIAAETRKKTIANYLQQRQQSLNKQTSLTSQGSTEFDTQPSPRVTRHNDTTPPSRSKQPPASSSSSAGK